MCFHRPLIVRLESIVILFTLFVLWAISPNIYAQTNEQIWGILNLDYNSQTDVKDPSRVFSRYRLQIQPRSDDLIADQDSTRDLERIEIQNSVLFSKKTTIGALGLGPGFTLVQPISRGTRGEKRPYLEAGYKSFSSETSVGVLQFETRFRLEARFQQGLSMIPRLRVFPRMRWKPNSPARWGMDTGIELFTPVRNTGAEKTQGLKAWSLEQLRWVPAQLAVDVGDTTTIALGYMIRRTFNSLRAEQTTHVTILSLTIHLDEFHETDTYDTNPNP